MKRYSTITIAAFALAVSLAAAYMSRAAGAPATPAVPKGWEVHFS